MTTAIFLPPPFAAPRPAEGRLPAAILPLVGVFGQLEELLGGMTDEQYRTKPHGLSGSVGGHVRHCLDHVAALLAALDSGELDYDRRERGTDVETRRGAALDALASQAGRLLAFPADSEARPLRLRALVSPALPPVEATTSVGRELAFVLSHTVHHNALVGVIASALGVAVPERFGYAPSTLAHLEKVRCVR